MLSLSFSLMEVNFSKLIFIFCFCDIVWEAIILYTTLRYAATKYRHKLHVNSLHRLNILATKYQVMGKALKKVTSKVFK